MFWTIVTRELKGIVLSPKFAATFGACALLILLSTFLGIQEYRNSVRQYDTARQLDEQEMRQQSDWMALSTHLYRVPDPMQVFVTGVNNDVGRWSPINRGNEVKLQNSAYADDPIFALFRTLDFAFIVQIVLSLFAILFTYDAISGERESGTLALTFSSPVPRVTYLAGKFTGAWLGLVLPLTVPVLLSILLVVVCGISMTEEHWLRLALLLGLSLLYFSGFLAAGILVSALTRHSRISFLVSLAVWTALVLIIPRVGILAAGQMVPVPSVAEIEGQRDGYAKQAWEQHMQALGEVWKAREDSMRGMSKEERESYRSAHLGNWMDQDDARRKEVEKSIEEYGLRLNEGLRNRTEEQEHLAFLLARISPAAAYQLAAMELATTDIGIKNRYEEAMRSYRTAFNEHKEKKQKASNTPGGMRITMDSEKGFSVSLPRERGSLDLSDLPRFVPPHRTIGDIVSSAVADTGMLVAYWVFALAGAFVVFLKYDVRG